MAAMLDNSQVRIEYRKYSSDLSEQLTVCPYALKEDMKRWYLVGYSLERDALRVYSLDRIVELKVLETKFRLPRNFDIDELFRDSYGVYLSENEEPQSIVLECDTEQARFLDGLPLHRSQRITWLTSKARVAIRVVPNPRLIMDLCALGPRIKVLSPDSVRDAVRESHRKALEE